MEPIQPIATTQLLDEAITVARRWDSPLEKMFKGKAEKAFEALRNGQIKLDNPQARIQRLALEDFETEGLKLLPDIKKSLQAEDGYVFYLATLPVLLFPGRGAQYHLLESQFTFDAGPGQRPLAIQNTFPNPSWKPMLAEGGSFRLALNGRLEWGAELLQPEVKSAEPETQEDGGDHPVKLAQKLQFIQYNLAGGSYTIVAKECVGLIEYALRQALIRHLPQLNAEDQVTVQELQEKMSRRGPLTMGGLLKLLQDSHFFEAWAQVSQKDLGSFRFIHLDEVRKVRNTLMHEYQHEVGRSEAEFLLHCVHVMFETFDLQDEILSPEWDEKPSTIAQLGSQLADRVGRLNRLSGFMGVTPLFEYNLGQVEIDAAFGPATAAWRLDSQGDIRSQAGTQFVILTKVPKEARQFTVEAAAQAEPSFQWLTDQIGNMVNRLPQAIQQIIRGRKGLPLQDFQTWTLELPKE